MSVNVCESEGVCEYECVTVCVGGCPFCSALLTVSFDCLSHLGFRFVGWNVAELCPDCS